MAGKMNALDRLIGWLSPQAFCRRMAWREEQKRYYDAARTDRFGASWFPPGSLSSENTDRPYRTLIRGRARDLERNNGIVRGLLRGLERNVVGAGIAAAAGATTPSTAASPSCGPTGASGGSATSPARPRSRTFKDSTCAAASSTATSS